MKKLLLFSLMLIASLAFSQNSLLFNKNWKIEKSIVNGNEIDVSNEPTGYYMTFYTDYLFGYVSKVCAQNFGKATFSTSSDDFTITETHGAPISNCSAPANLDNDYSSFFTKNSGNVNKVTYNIEEISNGYKLTLTNVSGDKLIYGFYNPPANLISNYWSVTSLDIDGVHYTPQLVENHTTFDFSKISAGYDNGGYGNIGYFADNKFQILDFAITLGMSDDPFDGLYLGAFFGAGGSPYPYSYDISADGKTLVITKFNGDFATYSKKVMAVSETGKSKYKVYPNPTSDIVTIENLKPNSALELIDSSGKIVKKLSNNKSAKTEINIRNLPAGVYYLRIDNQSVQKIIKK